MITNFTNTPNAYLADRYNFILMVEEGGTANLSPYNDGKGWVTIGCGFNLHDPNVRSQVLAGLGITDATLKTKLTEYLELNHDGISTSVIQEQIQDIMNLYGGGASFGFTSAAQVKTVFDGLAPTYEARVDTWAANNGVGTIPQSMERLALLSLAYNGTVCLTKTMAAAMKLPDPNDARAETWYQIRYVHPEQNIYRRYAEAAMFGLYPTDASGNIVMNNDVARATYRMFTQHRNGMLAYDATAAHQDQLRIGWNMVTDFPTANPEDLQTTLKPAADILVANYGQGQPFDYLHIQVAQSTGSTIYCTSDPQGNLIIGDIGADTFIGGNGNDILRGEGGNDDLGKLKGSASHYFWSNHAESPAH